MIKLSAYFLDDSVLVLFSLSYLVLVTIISSFSCWISVVISYR